MHEAGRTTARTAAVVLLVAGLLAGCGGSDGPKTTYVVCVDSTYSTDDVRPEYMPTLLAIVERGIRQGVHIYADACGSNATGTVHWPINEALALQQEYDGVLKSSAIKGKAKKMEPQLNREIVERTSSQPGTPLGEILAVVARQCKVDPGPCEAYVLTDGVWQDPLLDLRDGISPQEERRYVARYAPLLGGLNNVRVYFGGVGYGTNLGERRLQEAEQIARALIEKAGGEIAVWDVNLGALELGSPG